jgi:hypothetical protein
MAKYDLIGGLDLMTAKPLVKPGTLQDCLNYEVTTLAGYSRINGIVRYDGSREVGGYKVWRLRHVTPDTLYAAGDVVYFDPDLKGQVLQTDTTTDGVHVLYVMVPGESPSPSLPAVLTREAGGPNATIMSRDALFGGAGTQDTFNTALHMIAGDQAPKIGAVPGRGGSDITGLFWFKDRLYAIRDLPRIGFQGGYYTDDAEGKYVTVDGADYMVLNVRLTGDNQGVLTLDTDPWVSGPKEMAVPIGPATLVDLIVSGDLGDGYTSVPYADSLSVSGGVAPYVWSLTGESGTPVDALGPVDANAIHFIPQLTDAALYRSGDSGWERVLLGRELSFSNGTAAITNFPRGAVIEEGAIILTTTPTYPTAGTVNGVATTAMNADDGTLAALGSGDNTVYQATGFDFSGVPDNATIIGIEVTIGRRSDTAAAAKDMTVDLLGIPSGTINKSSGATWPNVEAGATYGSSSDLWGSQDITPARLKAPEFGVRVIAERAAPATPPVGGIDYIRIQVSYVQKDAPIYAWDGTSDVELILRHTQILTGDPSINAAQGYMNVSAPRNADKSRLINAGDQLRTGPNGTGDLLAIVAGRDLPIWLPGQAELDNNRARYMFTRTNFYGQDEFEAVYGCQGVGPAWCFDGVRCTRIRTQLPPELDMPRHIARHGDMLVLGYFPGALIFSQSGNPFETRGEEGASSIEVGDRLTNLAPLAGDALIVVCQSSTWAIRGFTAESMQKNPITTQRGGIEYTAVDMGKYVLCDGLGVFMADAPEQFGAASRNYMSQLVHPWLSPRLQAKANTESAFIRPIAALNVRNKNQMRLYFWDGWILTMTLNEPPEFTTQRYFEPAAAEHTEPAPWPVRALCTGLDSSGREHVFCSFYGAVKEGFVFEMDSGRSFDGAEIPARAHLNPLTLANSSQEKRYERANLYGAGLGVAHLIGRKTINDDDEAVGAYEFRMGRGDRAAKTVLTKFRGVLDSPGEAFDIGMMFESNTAIEGEHVLQYVEIEADDRGLSRGRQG